jgi:hypothetical protein
MPPSRPVNQGQRSAQREPEFFQRAVGQEAAERLFRPGEAASSGGQQAWVRVQVIHGDAHDAAGPGGPLIG